MQREDSFFIILSRGRYNGRVARFAKKRPARLDATERLVKVRITWDDDIFRDPPLPEVVIPIPAAKATGPRLIGLAQDPGIMVACKVCGFADADEARVSEHVVQEHSGTTEDIRRS